MAKGRVYQLVEVSGCRCLHVPLSCWPAITGIITDNEYQFESECYRTLLERVINMSCVCLPESFSHYNWMTWASPGVKTLNILNCPANTKRRLTSMYFLQESDGVAKIEAIAVKGTDTVTVAYKTNVASQIPQTQQGEVFMVEDDYIKLLVTVTADSGTFYYGFWGEEWTT